MNRMWVPLVLLVAVVVIVVAVVTSPAVTGAPDGLGLARDRLTVLEHPGSSQQASFGVQLDWQQDTPQSYVDRVGRTPALYGEFVEFPFRAQVGSWLDRKIERVRAQGGAFMLTLQPSDGLGSISDQALTDLTVALDRWNRAGTPVLVRFGQEMNGCWYRWGQQPIEYVAAFRRVAGAVRSAPASRILWSPNDASGYPFAPGTCGTHRTTADAEALDTSHDGRLTAADDPYQPYYPGDEYVDWVGLSLYHFGYRYPWGDNVIPPADEYAGKLTGDYHQPDSDALRADFDQQYAERPGKPLTISETSALFNTANTSGASDLEIKKAWWSQMFAPDIPQRFPQLRLINWFEQDKMETDVPKVVTAWSVTTDSQMCREFSAAIPSWLSFPRTARAGS